MPNQSIATIEAEVCAVCTGRNRSLIAKGLDFEYETCSNSWKVWECKNCGHLQISPRPDESTLKIIYPDNYYSYDMKANVSALALSCKAWLDNLKFKGIIHQSRQMPKSFLDIGCGDGRYLELMARLGIKKEFIHGLEFNQRAAENARAKGLNVHESKVEDAQFLSEHSFEMVSMFHVIEHLANPGDVIQSISKIMAPKGILVIETPNAESWDAALFRSRYWGGYHFPRHWHIFTPSSLARLLNQNGYDLLYTKYQPGHSFWLFSIHHVLKYKLKLPILARFFHPLTNIPALAIVVAFDLIRAKLGFKTSAMLMIAQKRDA